VELLGTVIPYAGIVISPCDALGVPAMTAGGEQGARFEITCVCIAWFGYCGLFPIGEARARAIDKSNPRHYAKGEF
jgi:hypothetical protein